MSAATKLPSPKLTDAFNRRAFTLIELLTIVAIIAIMVTVAVASIGSGQRVARIRGATRDIFATIRQARSVALVTQQATVITYSTQEVDGETCARVVLDSVKLMSTQNSSVVQTLSGETVDLANPNGTAETRSLKTEESGETESSGGESLEEILFAPVDEEIFRGIAIKVETGDEAQQDEEVRKATASAFSNAESLVGKYAQAKKQAEEKATASDDETKEESKADTPQEPVRIAWEPNGRCQPHQIWIYSSGRDPESGLLIKVDRFGAAKVISSEEDD